MGLDLFKDKKSLSSSSLLSGSGNVENIHQPRRLHVRLMQWPIGLILSKWRSNCWKLGETWKSSGLISSFKDQRVFTLCHSQSTPY
ncbi:hypothetical protein NC651_040461 [Populus alba x Populus x berolinensis]|nr:hypothetical protein NC651_040461 [Populus alba x Populus x berolinensis]